MRTGVKRPLLDSLQIEARTQTIVSPGVKKCSYSIFMGQADILPLSSTGTVVLRIQNLGQKGGARQGEQRTQDNQQPSHLLPCQSVNLQHGHIHRPDKHLQRTSAAWRPGSRAHQGLGWREVCCLHLEAYRPPSPEWQARERRPGLGEEAKFPLPARREARRGARLREAGRRAAWRAGVGVLLCASWRRGRGRGRRACRGSCAPAQAPARRHLSLLPPLGPARRGGAPGLADSVFLLGVQPRRRVRPCAPAASCQPARSLARRPPPQSAPSLARSARSPRPAPVMLSFQYPDVYRDETSVSTPLAPRRASGPAPPAARLPQPRVPAPRTASRPLFAEPAGVAGLLPARDPAGGLGPRARASLWSASLGP